MTSSNEWHSIPEDVDYDMNYENLRVGCPDCGELIYASGVVLFGMKGDLGLYDPGCDNCGAELELGIRVVESDDTTEDT